MSFLENPILQLSFYIIIPIVVTNTFKRFRRPNSTLNIALSFISVLAYFIWVTGYNARMITEAQDKAHVVHCGNVIMAMFLAHAIVGLPAAIITQVILAFVLRKKIRTE